MCGHNQLSIRWTFSLLLVTMIATSTLCAEESKSNLLMREFVEPPLSARPGAYWPWLNGYVNLPQITRELEEMKNKGMSGAEIWDVKCHNDPEKIVPTGPAFLGQESVKAICYTIKEATRLGLKVGMITSSGWNAGGVWVKPKDAGMGLYHCEMTVEGPAHFSQVLPFPQIHKRCPKEPNGFPVYYKNVAVLAFPQTTEKVIKDTSSIINLTNRVDKNGRLTWDVPAGKWIIMRFVGTNTGYQLIIPSPNSKGPMIDFLNPQATQMHMQYIIDKLLAELGRFDGTAFKYMEVDSMELGKDIPWTGNFAREFEKRCGYDPTAYLAFLKGWKMKDSDIDERFLYDYKKVVSDLLIESHYIKGSEILNKHGLLLCGEAGGPGPPIWDSCPVDALKALGAVDVARGEFWIQHRNIFLVKEIACAAHIYGKEIVDAESFTCWRHWQDGPFLYKQIADRALCEGLNRFTFHTFTHAPPEAGLPGWAYHAGSHINVNTTWWPKAKPFMYYLSRCCYLLQQGLFVGDVCYYYGDQAPNFVPAKHIDSSLGSGYDYDVTNTEVILTRMNVKDGKIVLPDGMSYELLVLPDRIDMNLQVLQKLEKMVKAGATIVGPKPVKSNGLTDYPHQDEKVRNLANKLWGPCDGKTVKEHTFGKGRVIWGRTLRDILLSDGIKPDFEFTSSQENAHLDYIHRSYGDIEIYFVANRKERWEEAECTFRVTGKAPELWKPDTGQMCKQPLYDIIDGHTKIPLRLAPYGSVFVVFRKSSDNNRIVSLVRNDKTLFPVTQGETGKFPFAELVGGKGNVIELRVWKQGKYKLKNIQGKVAQLNIETIPEPLKISGPWKIHFPKGWGAPESTVFEELISWTEDSDPGVKYFSGTACYLKEFDLPVAMLKEDKHLSLDLGEVKCIAEVTVNGKNLGILWKQPYRVDITEAARPGRNLLEVEVINLWPNRLIGDLFLPKDKRFTNTNITGHFTKESPLMESGLLGPVQIFTAQKLELEAGAMKLTTKSISAYSKDSREKLEDLAELATGWKGEVVAKVDQSYAGWDVEIGDADNDGKNEILVTGCPDSRLYLFKKTAGRWQSRLLAENLAHKYPGMGLVIKVVDLNMDGRNELILGTGQEKGQPAFFYILQTDGTRLTKQISCQTTIPASGYTHNLAVYDLDQDGVLETIAAYCSSGEIIRYDVDKDLTEIKRRKIHNCSGSGEDSFIADIDNDGKVEYLTCNCYRVDEARVEIFEFDEDGELVLPPRIIIDGYDKEKCFNCSLEIGDVDNDGRNELIVMWKTKMNWGQKQKVSSGGTLLGYRIDDKGARPLYTFACKDEDLDLGYGEKMMCVADADNDGKNELVVSTRGEPRWGGGGLGHILMFKVVSPDKIQKTLLVNFHQGKADACWPAVGDVDNDGKNEIVIATGSGHREKPGISYVVLVEKE